MNKNLPIIGMLLVLVIFAVSAAEITSVPSTINGKTDEAMTETFTFDTQGIEYSNVTFALIVEGTEDTSALFSAVSNPINGSESVTMDFTMPSVAGDYSALIRVTDDGTLLEDSATFTLEVVEAYALTITGTNSVNVFPEDAETLTVTVENTGAEDLTGLTWAYNTEDFVDEDGNQMVISFSEDDFGLVAGATNTVEVTITPHEDQYIYPEKDVDYAGALTLSNTDASNTFNLEVEMDSKAFGEITLDDLDDLDELEPGEEFQMEFEVENAKFDMVDVQIELTIYDLDEGDNIEEESDDFDLDDGDDETVEYEFEVPLNVDDKQYDVLVKVTGDSDEDNHDDFVYYFFYNDAIDVEKDEKYDAAFEYIELEPATPQCGNMLTIETEVVNIGYKKLDDMYVKVEIKELGIVQKSDDFDLKYDDEDDRTDKVEFTINLPEDMEKKTYTVEVLAYDEDNDLLGGLVETFIPTGNCIVSEEDLFEEQESEEENNNYAGSDENVDEDGTLFLPTGWAALNLFEDDSAKTVFWIIGDLALIVIIIYFLTLFFKKRK